MTHNDCRRQPLAFKQVKTFWRTPIWIPPKRLVWIRRWFEAYLPNSGLGRAQKSLGTADL